jgi:hypothetical protein
MQNGFDKAIDEFSACDQVTELNELAELTTLNKTLNVIISWTFLDDEIKAVGITAIGGVEAIVWVLQTFPRAPTCSGVGVVPQVKQSNELLSTNQWSQPQLLEQHAGGCVLQLLIFEIRKGRRWHFQCT